MNDIAKKPLVFITGTPRSGTSLITKVIDAHPDIAVLMESIFANRRRHWQRSEAWNSPEALYREVSKIYRNIPEPVLGNKVCTPDVWSAEDIVMFCKLFSDFKIIFIVRDPTEVSLSRLRREDYEDQFNAEARSNLLLNFQNRFHAYASSWRQSIENYWKFKDAFGKNVFLIYYEDLCKDLQSHVESICSFLEVPFSEQMINWHEFPHHDSNGELKSDLKYQDVPVFTKDTESQELPEELVAAMSSIELHYQLFKKRLL